MMIDEDGRHALLRRREALGMLSCSLNGEQVSHHVPITSLCSERDWCPAVIVARIKLATLL